MPLPTDLTSSRTRWVPVALGLALAAGIGVVIAMSSRAPLGDAAQAEEKGKGTPAKAKEDEDPPQGRPLVKAPELDGGVAWLNTGKPLTLKDLKGKVVLLDFWTLCCINCIHIMPDLARLEKKYPNELVVVGVHSPKFDNEKDTKSIRKAVLRYEIAHPVVNDADHKIWDHYEIDAWPTLVLIDPEGNLVGYTSGEGNYELLDTVIK